MDMAAIFSERLIYEPISGLFTWRPKSGSSRAIAAWNGKWAGKAAGGIRGNGYIYIGLDGKSYLAHRVAWTMIHGREPDYQIDHENRDTTDNRLINLRAATQSQNNANQKLSVRNTSGYRGVTWHRLRSKWMAQIKVGGKHRCLGYFDTVEEAANVYADASIDGFGEFSLARAA